MTDGERPITRKVKFANGDVFDAMVNTGRRFGYDVNQFVEEACKEKLRRLNVTWWESRLEINTPKES